MPEFATIKSNVTCWNCEQSLSDCVEIQWGHVPGSYRIGDEVEWLHINDVMIEPFTLVDGFESWNCGDPNIENVIALDCNLFAIDSDIPTHCSNCNSEISAVAVSIVDNKIKSVKSVSQSDLQSWLGSNGVEADIITVNEDGSYSPRAEWYDHSIKFVERDSIESTDS